MLRWTLTFIALIAICRTASADELNLDEPEDTAAAITAHSRAPHTRSSFDGAVGF